MRRGADATRDVPVGRPVEGGKNPGLHRNALGGDDRLVAGAGIAAEAVEREVLTKMHDQAFLAVGNSDANQRQVKLFGEIEAERAARGRPGPLVDALGVEKQAVHVEDEGLGLTVHGVGSPRRTTLEPINWTSSSVRRSVAPGPAWPSSHHAAPPATPGSSRLDCHAG